MFYCCYNICVYVSLKNCLHFRRTIVHFRFLVRFVLLTIEYYRCFLLIVVCLFLFSAVFSVLFWFMASHYTFGIFKIAVFIQIIKGEYKTWIIHLGVEYCIKLLLQQCIEWFYKNIRIICWKIYSCNKELKDICILKNALEKINRFA